MANNTRDQATLVQGNNSTQSETIVNNGEPSAQTPIEKTYTQSELDKFLAEKEATYQQAINDRDERIKVHELKEAAYEQEILNREEQIESLLDKLVESEKPSFEAQKQALKAKGLVAVLHRGLIKQSTIGSVNGKPIQDLTDEELDNLVELNVISEIPS